MCVESFSVRREFTRKHTGLPEPPQPVRCTVTRIVRPEHAPRRTKTWHARGECDSFKNTQRVIFEVFGQVMHPRFQSVVQGMRLVICRVPQRPDFKTDTRFFQSDKFLSNESLRQARPSFDHDRQSRVRSCHFSAIKASTRATTTSSPFSKADAPA